MLDRLFTSVVGSVFVVAMFAVPARADDDSNRARAAQAYERGAAAFRAREYSTAADWFERANRLAPSSIAIVQAIRSHTEAHNTLRAGSLALRVESDLTLSVRARESVRLAISAASERFLRVDVVCSAECSLAVDGAPIEAPSFFMEPNDEFEIVATFSNGTKSERVIGNAGEVRTVQLEAPPGATAAAAVSRDEVDLMLEGGENPYRISRTRFLSRPRATFFTGLAASTGASAIAVWSILDAENAEDDYTRAVESGTATPERLGALRALRDRSDRRTRGFLVFSGGMFVMTGIVAALTDWTPHGERESDTEGGIVIGPSTAVVTIRHRY